MKLRWDNEELSSRYNNGLELVPEEDAGCAAGSAQGIEEDRDLRGSSSPFLGLPRPLGGGVGGDRGASLTKRLLTGKQGEVSGLSGLLFSFTIK